MGARRNGTGGGGIEFREALEVCGGGLDGRSGELARLDGPSSTNSTSSSLGLRLRWGFLGPLNRGSTNSTSSSSSMGSTGVRDRWRPM